MKLHSLIEQATQREEMKVAVAGAEDKEIIKAVAEAVMLKMASFILFGDKERILELLDNHQQGLAKNERIRIEHAINVSMAAEKAVKTVKLNQADVLMKGQVETARLLKAVLNKEYGLRTGNLLSHVAVFEVPDYDRLIVVTDAAMNITPDLQQKAQIITNAVKVARSIGIDKPKVAPIAAVETVNPAMQATLDAAALSVMNARGQISDCIVDGPFALDNAVSLYAAQAKGINSEVAGKADILLVPSIEVGNVLYKSLMYFAKAKVGAVIAGARAPIVLTSRADSAESKLYSLALAICTASNK
ncbi:phosphate butyryltransferase [Bacillus sp. CECT 9360]|uniref:phosphate butyryltransferase n=1 Tax=Bacillus sp. CECT 9360 TaxID=2845821 RepID=UPI001E383BBF|nr:phosphate butyryltransferase [Bacillus sp. CECT 9360]CAH0345667.1 Phosphate acetyltransferase [Bacillus sp. CECT 9360]